MLTKTDCIYPKSPIPDQLACLHSKQLATFKGRVSSGPSTSLLYINLIVSGDAWDEKGLTWVLSALGLHFPKL